ncbi:MAG: hypothetical protein QF568_02955 [Flavobacteriales bacterium]|jgi:hypothetical protein|nr:hypothetical protein [Flavobacteriales bacterium]|tara:strand:- start:1725 stop:2534 length:810 start_codon:yes stop_codon:yes gene_type:complete
MGDSDVDDIFDDFESKVEGKEDTAEEKEINEEELLKRKYQEAEQDLKEKHKKEKEALAEKRKKEMMHGEAPTKSFPNIEKIAYMAIILVLAAYIVFDLSSNHWGKGIGIETDQTITAAVVQKENKTDEIGEVVEEVEEVEEEPVVEEKELSGVIALNIDNIYTTIIDEDNDLGEISKIVFTIDNGKDKVLTPLVRVYAYDSEMEEKWETWSRGEYTYEAGIASGKEHTGVIDLSPKKFINLDLKKSIRLTLNDTEDGFITAVNEKVLIE